MVNDYQDTIYGRIPANWNLTPLDLVFKPVNIRMKDFVVEGNDLPILSMTRTNGLVRQSEKFDRRVASRDTSNYKIVKKGQLVYGFPIDEGVIAIQHRYPVGAVSPAYHVWEPKIEIDLNFMDHMLKTSFMINAYLMFSSNVVERRRNLSPKDFLQIRVPLPPLPEQRAIAHVLSTVREAIEATERVIIAARELKRSLMKYLFTYGPVPIDQADQVPLKETEIGEVPEGWMVEKVGKVTTKLQYGYTEKAIKEKVGPNFLRITDIHEDGSVNWPMVPYCNCTDSDYQKYALHDGDILVARIGATTGKSFFVRNCPSSVFASYLIRIRTDGTSLLPAYLYHFMNTPTYWSQIYATKGGRLKQGVNIPNLQNLLMPIPDLMEQESIVETFNSIEIKIQKEVKKKTALEALFNSLLHHLMTGKVRVPPEYYPT